MRPIIEFCQSNLAAGTHRVKEELEKDNNLDVIEYGCLGFCGQCYESPYALVNGTIVTGETPKTLLENIREQVRKEEEELF
ncbi:YuzB family protein [Caldalkalibacillus salinus]|uniref:YuzB family protein n=1 Tax=Caldalkalibacillus salinus TaxID=2803787 RepID=UPI001921C92A|nr:YuzB family protein [Caldalkalibacillus salinus]